MQSIIKSRVSALRSAAALDFGAALYVRMLAPNALVGVVLEVFNSYRSGEGESTSLNLIGKLL